MCTLEVKFHQIDIDSYKNRYINKLFRNKEILYNYSRSQFGPDTLKLCLLGGQNNPIDQNLEFNKNLRGSAENWFVWQIMHPIYLYIVVDNYRDHAATVLARYEN